MTLGLREVSAGPSVIPVELRVEKLRGGSTVALGLREVPAGPSVIPLEVRIEKLRGGPTVALGVRVEKLAGGPAEPLRLREEKAAGGITVPFLPVDEALTGGPTVALGVRVVKLAGGPTELIGVDVLLTLGNGRVRGVNEGSVIGVNGAGFVPVDMGIGIELEHVGQRVLRMVEVVVPILTEVTDPEVIVDDTGWRSQSV